MTSSMAHPVAGGRPLWRRALFPLGMLAGCVGIFWMIAGHSLTHGNVEHLPPEPPRGTNDPQALAVTASPIVVRPVQRTVEAVGTLYGYEEVVLRAKVEGRVKRVVHDVSDRVAPGLAVIEIDPADSELAVMQAEKNLLTELARLGLTEPPARDFNVRDVPLVAQSIVRQENARDKAERAESLSRRAVISSEELAERKAEARSADAEVANQILLANAALATIQMRQQALAIAQKQLSDTVIRVPTPTQPIPGMDSVRYAVTSRTVSEGTFVRVGDEVCKLMIDGALKLRVAVPERHSQEVALDQSAAIFTASSSTPFPGTVSRINPAVDPVTRTFEVEILCLNADRRMKPGGFAKADITTRQDSRAVTVPLEALVTFAGISKIFLVEPGRAREVRVTLGVQTTDWVEIASPPLEPGATVITSGQSVLADGSSIFLRAPVPSGDSSRPAATVHQTASAGSAP